MLPLLTTVLLAQSQHQLPAPLPVQDVIQSHPVRSLPGQLDDVPVFNSNSPEVVTGEGILLSTFDPQGKTLAPAHLNYVFEGRFDIFVHHIARPETNPNEVGRLMNIGILVFNPGRTPVTLKLLQGLSYTNADAPFIDLPTYVDNAQGQVFSGPGSRLADDIQRGITDPKLSVQLVIPPGQSQLIFNRPIPNRSLRSTFLRLHSSGKIQVASIALLDKPVPPPPAILAIGHRPSLDFSLDDAGLETPAAKPLPNYRSPILSEWQAAVNTARLATPRDLPPTNPRTAGASLVYGRVAGVSKGSRWNAWIADKPGATDLSLPARGQAVSFVLSAVERGTLGTGKIQSAPMLVRYPDTAYSSHGNYMTQYRLTMPLVNKSTAEQIFVLKMQTPLKQEAARDNLHFLVPPEQKIYFRGTVQIRYPDETGAIQTKRVHIVQKRGEQGEALLTLKMPPGERRQIEIDLVYPPDATPPQVLTMESIAPPAIPPQAEKIVPLILVPTP